MNNSQAAKFFEVIKTYHKHINDDYEQPQIVIPTLRSYQRRAVKWMVDREKNNDFVKCDGSPFSGGILADEMGLGKTVEMLCCIMENTAPPEFYNQKVVIKDCLKIPMVQSPSKPSTSKYIAYTNDKDLKTKSTSSSRSMLESWYKSILSEMSTVPKKTVESNFDEDTHIVACYCKTTPPKSVIVYCAMCGKGQHAQCVHFEPKPFQELPYLCSNCWIANDRLQCKATLIVVPQSILNQWIDEIEKHIAKPGLNVYVYNGVHFDGYIQPSSFGDYDIVITSYTTLSRDLNYVANVDVENHNSTRLRHSKRYNYPQSPLPCIKWWRICLDEGQAIESATSKVCDMTLNLRSVHKWAMTGTPIQKSLNDLYGILKFLEVSPYCYRKQFQQLMKGEETIMYTCFSKLIWRSSIEDVNSELNLPKITTEQHWLTFSQIEKYFYLSQHDDCATVFSNCVTRLFPSLDISVKNIDRKSIYTIIGPLYKLRQACVHPQAVNGQFLKIKGTMTMEKLMDVMIDRCRLVCNEYLRSLVSQHNALAGLYLIREEPATAVEHYRTVLGLMEKYKDKQLKIDTCQKIHVMYNLATVLDENTTVSHALNDSNLKKDMELLEKEYLDASKQNIESTCKTVMFYSDKVAKIIKDKTLGYSDWWSDMLDWIFSPNDFLAKVQMELEDYRVPGVPNIANRLKSVNDVYNILGVWLADLDTARIQTISKLKTLQETPMNDLVQSALICHLRLKAKKGNSKNRKCLLCKAEMELQLYESLLFSVSNKQKNTLNDNTEEKDQETMYESTSKGLWKMSQKEFLLMKLFQYGQAKIINKSCLEDAAEHMNRNIYIYTIYMCFFVLSSPIIIIQLMTGYHMVTSQLRFADQQLPLKAGIYYENVGPIKIITNTWDLVLFLDTSTYSEHWDAIEDRLNKIARMCTEIDKYTETIPGCQPLLIHAYTINKKLSRRKQLLLDTVEPRVRRGVMQKVSQAARVLYGLCNTDCINKIESFISKLFETKTDQMDIINENIRILNMKHEGEGEHIMWLNKTIYDLVNVTNFLFPRIEINKQFAIINQVMLIQILKVNTLVEILLSARSGQIHPSLMSTKDLLEQLKNIKLNLPSGTNMPLEVQFSNVYNLIKLSDLTVYTNNNNIVFILNIPLVYQHELSLYNLIPLPVCVPENKKKCMYIKPKHDFLAVTKTKELYSTYDNFNPTICKSVHDFLLCPETHPLHSRSMRPMCEILLMQEPKEVPESCEIRHIEMATSVFHKLRHKNEWLYVTNNDSIFVTCDEDRESKSHILEGAGIILLNETCRGYANRDVLIPGRLSGKSKYTDFIPTSVIRDLWEETTRSKFTKTMEPHHIKTNQMHDLNEITYTQDQVANKIQQKEQYEQLETTVYIYLITGSVAISVIIVINILIIWFIKHETTKTPLAKPCACPFLVEERWTQTTIPESTMGATAPTAETAEVFPEEESVASTFIYPKLKN